MKQFLAIAAILAAAVLAAAVLAGCPNPNEDDENQNPPAVDFTSRNTGYSILVRNNVIPGKRGL
jgi:hypothetical protein